MPADEWISKEYLWISIERGDFILDESSNAHVADTKLEISQRWVVLQRFQGFLATDGCELHHWFSYRIWIFPTVLSEWLEVQNSKQSKILLMFFSLVKKFIL